MKGIRDPSAVADTYSFVRCSVRRGAGAEIAAYTVAPGRRLQVVALRLKWAHWSRLREMPRRRVVGVAAAVAGAAVGFVALRSDADEGGNASRDAAGMVTAPVERRVLESLQVTRGAVISPAQATVLAPPPREGELATVVTGVPLAQGAEVVGGSVVAELNGRPVFALAGSIPVFRDIRPGHSGPDVEAIHAALQALGYEISESERSQTRFGWSSRNAIKSLYENAGYQPTYTLGSAEAVAAASDAAEDAVGAAQEALNLAVATNPDGVAAARDALDSAEGALDHVQATEGVMLPAGELVAVPRLPAVLVDLVATDGQRMEAGAPVATVGSQQFQVRIELTSAQVNELADDVEIEVFADNGYQATCLPTEPSPADEPKGDTATTTDPASAGAAEAQEPGPADGGGDGGGVATSGDFVMDVICDPLPPGEALGVNLRVTMTVLRSDGPVLVVPATAVTTTASADAYVEVVGAGGVTTRVPVTVGGEADGFVAVAPVDGDALAEGMDVRVRRG